MTSTEAISNAKRQTDQIVAIRDQRGWERPAEYSRLITLGAAAKAAIRDAEPAPLPQPTTADEVDDWISATANARVLAAARRTAAEELATEADRQVALLGQTLAVETIPPLVTEFGEHLATFASLSGAPRVLSGHESAKQLTAHAALLRCAADLAATVFSRAVLADITGEGEAIGTNPVWLVLAPTARAGLDATSEVIRRFHQSMPSTVADWDSLIPLGVALATFGEAEARIQRHTETLFARGMQSPDGGLLERTYGEVQAGAH